MCKRIAFAVLLVSMIGCTVLKERFGTGRETPELNAVRAECRQQAEKEARIKFRNVIRQKEHIRKSFDACMNKNGYSRTGQKLK